LTAPAFPGFSSTVFTAFYLLGLTVIAHIFLVSLVLGIAVIVPFLEWRGYRNNDDDLLELSRRLFKFLAVTDLVAGVWATWMTVALAGYWSTLLFAVTTKLFLPITIAIVGILISLPSMAAYYYLWGKVSRRVHLLIGVLMIIGTLLVPIGMNAIFTFIDYPVASTSAWAGLLNPLYPIFTIHRVFGGIVMAALAFSAFYTLKLAKKSGKAEEDSSAYLKGVRYGLYVGLTALVVQTVTGMVFGIQLMQYSPYLASAVFGNVFAGYVPTYYDFAPLFAVFVAIVAILWISGLYNLNQFRKMRFSKTASYVTLFAAMAGVPLIEFVHDAARFPYFVIDGSSGVPASTFVNSWMVIPSEFAMAAILVAGTLMTIFLYLLYSLFLKAFGAKL
jgi:hypothetical protein